MVKYLGLITAVSGNVTKNEWKMRALDVLYTSLFCLWCLFWRQVYFEMSFGLIWLNTETKISVSPEFSNAEQCLGLAEREVYNNTTILLNLTFFFFLTGHHTNWNDKMMSVSYLYPLSVSYFSRWLNWSLHSFSSTEYPYQPLADMGNISGSHEA